MIVALVTTLVHPSEADFVGDSVRMTFNVSYYGPGVLALQGRNVDSSTASIMPDPADTTQMLHDEMVDAVIAEGARFGYVVAENKVVVPALLRGR